LTVDNFAMDNGRKAGDMSQVFKFCLEKSIKPACYATLGPSKTKV